MPVFKVIDVKEPREFEGDGYILIANSHSCPFCAYCTDIYYDYTNGPYWFYCGKHAIFCDTLEDVLRNGCEDYE